MSFELEDQERQLDSTGLHKDSCAAHDGGDEADLPVAQGTEPWGEAAEDWIHRTYLVVEPHIPTIADERTTFLE